MRDFLRSLLADWIALVSGIASFLLALTGAIFVASWPSWVFWPAAYVCLAVASYRVWKKTNETMTVRLAACQEKWEERQNELTTELARLQAQINQTGMTREKAHKLSDFHREAGELRAGIVESDDATSVEEWSERIGSWVRRVSQYMSEAISPAQGQYFCGHVSYNAAVVHGLKSNQTRQGKNNLILSLEARLERLEVVMNRLEMPSK